MLLSAVPNDAIDGLLIFNFPLASLILLSFLRRSRLFRHFGFKIKNLTSFSSA